MSSTLSVAKTKDHNNLNRVLEDWAHEGMLDQSLKGMPYMKKKILKIRWQECLIINNYVKVYIVNKYAFLNNGGNVPS